MKTAVVSLGLGDGLHFYSEKKELLCAEVEICTRILEILLATENSGCSAPALIF